jgi:hypothetical protein
MENMTMKQYPCMTLHFCSESPRIDPFEEPKTEAVDTPDERGRHRTWSLDPSALRQAVATFSTSVFLVCKYLLCDM